MMYTTHKTIHNSNTPSFHSCTPFLNIEYIYFVVVVDKVNGVDDLSVQTNAWQTTSPGLSPELVILTYDLYDKRLECHENVARDIDPSFLPCRNILQNLPFLVSPILLSQVHPGKAMVQGMYESVRNGI